MKVKEIKRILKENKIFLSKRLGQNFLIGEKIISKILKAADLSSKDFVLEIGPGIGNLTIEIAKKVKKVMAIEKDQRLVKILKENLERNQIKNVEVIEGDILKILNSQFPIQNSYKVVANLPFYLTARLIRKLLESKNQPKEMILLIQKEVGQRICAKAPKMNLLAVSVQFYGEPKIISFVSKKFFWPRPKVDSAIIKIVPKKSLFSFHYKEKFFKIAKAAFSHPRKQILNNFSRKLKLKKEKTKEWLLKNKLCPKQRAETLTLDDLLNLTKSFKMK
jgi:16S rRNA (adenine1518-N6/adenine1519-N6)-dimethyltransferase